MIIWHSFIHGTKGRLNLAVRGSEIQKTHTDPVMYHDKNMNEEREGERE